MSLRDWLSNTWLVEHETSAEEVADLLAIVERDLANARVQGLSADWRLNIAYNAALQAATAALAAAGYRAPREAHHYRTIHSLQHTIGWSAARIGKLDALRKKRNIGGYEKAGAISDREAEEMSQLAQGLRDEVTAWLKANYPGLLRAGGRKR